MDSVKRNDGLEVIADPVQNISNENEENRSAEASGPYSNSLSSDSKFDTDINKFYLIEYEMQMERKWYEVKVRELKERFFILKELVYKEKRLHVPEFKNTNLNITIRYTRALEELNDQFERRLTAASISKQIKLMKIDRRYKDRKQAIEKNFVDKKQILYDTLKSSIEDEMRQLKEEF